MKDVGLDKWIIGETDTYFNPGKKGILLRWCEGFASRQWIAIVVAAACVLGTIGVIVSRTSSPGRNEMSPPAHSALPPMAVVVPPRPEPLPSSGKASAHNAESGLSIAQASTRPHLTDRVDTFMNSYWQSVEQSSDRVLSYLDSIYAPMVTYYGKLLPKRAVLRDKYYFLKHWPVRQTWEPGSPNVSCNEAVAECEISGVRKYKAMNADRRASGMVRCVLDQVLRWIAADRGRGQQDHPLSGTLLLLDRARWV